MGIGERRVGIGVPLHGETQQVLLSPLGAARRRGTSGRSAIATWMARCFDRNKGGFGV